MSDLLILGRGVQRAIVPLLGIVLIVYMSYHAFIGERGLFTHWRLQGEARELTAKLEVLTAERAVLENRIALLSSDNLDRDMLNERARAVLNYADPNEITIMRRGQ